MKKRSRADRVEDAERDWLMKLLICYFQWCIGELPENERIDLEHITPTLQAQFGGTGTWYEIFEQRWGLPPSGRKIVARTWRDMRRRGVSVEEFLHDFTITFIEQASQTSVPPGPPIHTRRRHNH